MLLCEWEDTRMEKLVATLKFIEADMMDEMVTLSDDDLRLRCVQIADRARHQLYFETKKIPSSTPRYQEYLNKTAPTPWTFDQSLRDADGDLAAQTTRYDYVPDVTKILTVEDQMRFWAFSKFQTECVRARLSRGQTTSSASFSGGR